MPEPLSARDDLLMSNLLNGRSARLYATKQRDAELPNTYESRAGTIRGERWSTDYECFLTTRPNQGSTISTPLDAHLHHCGLFSGGLLTSAR